MAKLRKRNRSGMSSIDQINMTPLIDLTFLLLIVFMITMPLMEYSTKVSAPEMKSDVIDVEKENKIIVLDRDEVIYLDKQVVSKGELAELLQNLKVSAPDTNILIKADGDCYYKRVIELMKIAKNNGFENVSLVTSEEK